tara:strand:+ start:238 stop:342 length:105 start_codon:yes stop_codon:yes gene_type:complete
MLWLKGRELGLMLVVIVITLGIVALGFGIADAVK